jgi:UDP-N-acetylmuramoyl-tripeptide--D-alanyl-D-alanine ligase
MIEGLKVLNKVSHNKSSVAVLGDMSELGKLTVSGHQKVGKAVSQIRPKMLLTIGPKAKIIGESAVRHGFPKNRIRSFSTQAQALSYIRSNISKGSVIYFKASRSMGLEWLVNRLRRRRS